jgi:hypothetical protein
MMPKPSDAALARLQRHQNGVMDDLCCIVHVSRSSGTYSTQSTETRTMVSGVACGIQFTNGQLKQGSQVLLIEYDAILRLPSSQPVLITDEIQLIEKGVTVISGTFRPVSYPVVSSSVQHVNLKRVAS